jgi:predicted dehydrogenase
MKRREFLQQAAGATAATTLGAAASAQVAGANERIRVGLIGCGTRGMAVARLMRQVPNVEFTAVCDVYERNLTRAREWAGNQCQAHRDFRRVLDMNNVDAVLVATPDHWHAIPSVLACRASKDVYVEKPLAHNIREGRAIVEAARRHRRVVQTGTQHRSAEHYREVQRIIQRGDLGRIHFVRVWNYTNMYPRGIGQAANGNPPEGLDWDFYLGPAPSVPFNRNRFLGSFRWFWDYAGGFITDWGTHRLDSVHQVMGVDAPQSVTAFGGRYELRDGAETPDVMQVTYEYPGFILSYESNMINGHGSGGRTPNRQYYRARGPDDRPHGEAFYGTNGTLFSDRIGFEIYPELEAGGQPGGQPRFRMKRQAAVGRDQTDLHVRNFIECVRSRATPAADVLIGHRSTIVPHLGNIAYRVGRKIRWDTAKEEILGDAQA